ncbi:uncharacterized protein [Spinacia oleracea]|uniref:Integrase catalytic domain-containing protein n=1 Tax=Spinacia oleracea TaxID=3562 RepID=A0ABM3QQ15_SPIOL|nr:uncharacterized protein LOC110799428 [Spinacia oleracea]
MHADQATDPSLNPNSAYFLSNNDVNVSKLVSIVFDGKCFNDWKRSMVIALSARNKLCFVDGSLMISWILASLEPSIARSVLYLKTAREIWLDLEDRLCQSSGSQLFSIQLKLYNLNQDDDEEISSFFTKIKLMWDQLDGLDPLTSCSCTSCCCTLIQKLLKSQQNQRLIQFLMKLNSKYEHPKSIILMMNPLPTISKAYGLLLQHDQQREVQNNRGHMNSESIVFTAMKFIDNKYSSSSNSQNTYSGGQSRNNTRNNLFCEHCRMKNHTFDKCWKLHRYPKDFKGKGKRVAAAVQMEETYAIEKSAQEETSLVHATFTEEQYNQLMKHLNTYQDHSKKRHTVLAKLNKGLYSLNENLMGSVCKSTSNNFALSSACFTSIEEAKLWLLRLGHVSFGKIKNIKGIDVKGCLAECFCQIFPLAKQSKFPFSFLTVVDDYTRMTWTHLMKSKTDSVQIMTQFLSYVENQFGTSIKTIRSNNAPDLTEGEMKQLLLRKCVLHQKSCSHTPQQNDVVERKHKHLLETARAL